MPISQGFPSTRSPLWTQPPVRKASFGPNSSLYAGTPYQRATADLLLTWMLNPGTAFYLGYVNRDASAAINGVLPALGRTFSPAAPTERQLFVKLSYSFRP